MDKDILQTITQELNSIQLKRHQLMFLVTDDFSKDIRFVSENLNIPYINVNFELSKKLKDLPVKKRLRKVIEFLKNVIRNSQTNTLVLDHIEILFDPQLQQNPVSLLENISRNHTLIVGWKGRCYGQNLVYGEVEYDEYFNNNTEGSIIEF